MLVEQGLFDELVESGGRYARVALDTPVRREFSYRIPAHLEPLEEGQRVRVPFGARRRVGVVVGLDPHPPSGVAPSRLKDVEARLDEQPLVTPALLRLARHLADTTYCSMGQALAAMLPAALRHARARRTVPVVELAREPESAELEELERRYPKQERAVAWLRAAGGPVEVRDFCTRTGLSKSPLDSLARKGLVRFERKLVTTVEVQAEPVTDPLRPEPTQEQQACIASMQEYLERRKHGDYLLFGITGSGKTEVYLRVLERCLELGRGGIVLVPEIALTPQTVARFRSRCGQVAVLHSGLTDAERHDQWTAIREGRLRVVVGARSALFAPVRDLGLIVVDEEHDSSFKQEQVPRYHARDVARERARLERAVCVLGSATPSLESWSAALRGEIRLLELSQRVGGGQLPQVRVVDMRTEKAEDHRWLVMSEAMRGAIEETLARSEQAILFLNRRGFAPAWHCRACGETVHCERCDVALTYHRWRQRAICHYCLNESAPPTHCPGCRAEVRMVGVGTERAEESLQRAFPEARIARMDRDTMLRRESYEEVLGGFGRGEIDLLLGTQMVAKGLDFPNVTLVGVLHADMALHHPDFRAAERCFNLVAQVAGRAGRSARGGQVVVQTWLPEHPAIRAAVRHDFRRFAEHELSERRDFDYPPAIGAVRILFESEDREKVESLAQEAATQLRTHLGRGDQVLGPAAPVIERIRGRHRRQILLKRARTEVDSRITEVLYDLCQRQGVVVDPL